MGKKIRKVIAILLCITSVLILCLPADTSYASTIHGDFEMDGSTLVKYLGSEENLTLPNTIEVVGKEAFANNTNLVKVTMLDSVKKIDFAAFENCTNLRKVVIPESVKAIGSSAFSGCENLQDINVGAKCAEIGSGAFAKCNKLANVNINSENPYYLCADGVIYTTDGKEVVQYLAGRTRSAYSMPKTIEKIDEYAFWGATQLADVSLSAKLKEIPEYAFSNCKGLSNVIVPYNVESLMAYSFSDCYNLENIIIPDTVGYIDDNAFYLTKNVNVNYYDADAVKNKVEASSGEENFEDYVESVSNNDGSYNIYVSGSAGERIYYENLPYVSSMTPDYSDNTSEGELASSKIVGGKAVVFLPRDVKVRGFDVNEAEHEDGIATAIGSNSIAEYNVISDILSDYNGKNSNPQVPSNVKKLGNRVFYRDGNIDTVTMPSGLKSIGDFAFARSAIKSISVPNGTEEIGYAAFYNCNGLNEISVPDSVKRIELGAFDGTPWLENWLNADDSDNYLIKGDGILVAYKGEGGNVSVPNGVKTIGAGCFKGNLKLTGISLPDSLETIGEDAFNGCSALRNVELPDSLENIEDRAFKDCRLKQVIIPKNVRNIGLGAFDSTSLSADRDSETEVVIFLGKSLPKVTYKNTATRLSAYDLRSKPFEGIKNAVIGTDATLDKTSVLSEDEYGFRGLVYNITSDASAKTGELSLLSVTAEPDDEGNVVIDPHLSINDKQYIMTGVKDEAFKPYENVEEWAGKGFTSIGIEGNTSKELDELLDNVSKLYGNKNIKHDNKAIHGINIFMDPALSREASSAYASMMDIENDYNLYINSIDSSNKELIDALSNRYGSTSGINYVGLDISMYDDKTDIPIKRLSNKKMDIQLPIPDALLTEKNISVASVNDNGKLEELSSEIVNSGGNDRIKFIASHFSIYVIYAANDSYTEIINEIEPSLAINRQSVVVKTLHKKVGTVEVKWYISIILFSLAMILLLYRGRPARLEK